MRHSLLRDCRDAFIMTEPSLFEEDYPTFRELFIYRMPYSF